ncbi:MAG: tRNA (adenosine(37)-N6)-threonylcarbamoyltransferase complex ATPase subunit type 1 TsaE [Bacteroidales bacterium]|jgi:tRNA threonylcarbamoyladenosine biosynthesis protein TsaE|nr:tRNA (adenosine(37)-N6)-threonylcarbamoyltransferase complex ATPase subunit type 1 TsaE [Bacteroidales bacterium]
MFKIEKFSLDILGDVASALLAAFPDERVFAFFAPMGAGKTTFIKELCKVLNVEDDVVSPTFAIVNEYSRGVSALGGDSGGRVFHFDLYRLKNIQEVFDIGFNEYVTSGSYCFIEWAEVIDGHISVDYVRVEIFADDTNDLRSIVARKV